MIDLYTWPTPNGEKVHIFLEERRSPQQMDQQAKDLLFGAGQCQKR